ncbi:Phosphotransferase enzyme family [Fusarium albosuccineum]|uniref:Phosphotransferase enzyme family n=1 Tax=Fusarium albosuccineum TaxID=1237068 RepID=A0A8H4L319_9HYPO|nr:Phosphotransferase enzyme family [Fusarium albosuccineum]
MAESAPYDVLFVDRSQNYSIPLPTPNDLDGSDVLLHESSGSRLVRMQQTFVLKYGAYVEPIEAYNMLFVAKSTTVPVPKVYAIYQRREEQRLVTYIVMQYVHGTTLLNLWESLDQARKTSIAKTLRTHFDQLRELQHPGFFGNIDGGPPLDDMFLETKCAEDINSSFATEDELTDCIVRIYGLETGERMAHKARYYQHVLPTVLRGQGTSVFTHNDFQRKNIMIQEDGTVVIIDWEFASWYPTYWEYSSATWANSGWNDDWHDYVRIALDEYPNQSLWLSSMKLEMWS